MKRTSKIPFSLQELNRIEDHLNKNAQSGKPIPFEVTVDGLTAINRTENAQDFSGINNFIDPGATRFIIVKFYNQQLNRVEKIVMYIEKNLQENQSLEGIQKTFQELETQREKMAQADLERAREKW